MIRAKEGIKLDVNRVKMIMDSPETIEVLYQGAPVWIENLKDNNSAEVTYLTTHQKIEVPVYKLVENNPRNI